MKKLMIMVGSLVAANVASAAGFGIYEASARGNAMGGALVGATGDATANYYNPANMTDATNFQFAVGVTFIQPFCDVEVEHRSQGRMDPGWFTVPSFYVTIPLPWDFAIGWGNYTEYGLGSEYRHNWDLAGDTQKTTLEQMTLNPNLAYKITDWWSVSAGPRISWISFCSHKQPNHGESLSGSVTNPYYNQLTGMYGMPSTLNYTIYDAYHLEAKLKGDDWGAGWTAATDFKLHEKVRLGIVYRSEIRHKISGKFNLHGTAGGVPNVQLPTVPDQLAAMLPGYVNGGVIKSEAQYQSVSAHNRGSAKLRLPQSLTCGLNWDVTPSWRVGSALTWTNWRSIKNINFNLGKEYSYRLPLHWHDSVRVSFGTEYDITDWMQIRGSYTYDRDPSSKANASTMIPAGDRHIIGAGLGFQIIDNLWLDLSYNFIRMNNEHYYVGGKYISYHNGFSHLVGASIRYSF